MNLRRLILFGVPLLMLVWLQVPVQAQEEPRATPPSQEPPPPPTEPAPPAPDRPLPAAADPDAPVSEAFPPPPERPTPGAEVPDAPPAQPEDPELPPIIDSRQIDRYEAIRQLTESLQQDSRNLTDWIILAELSQEVAQELPSQQALGYHRLARQAYQSALTLAPENSDLRAAFDFAREQEENAQTFHEQKRQLTEHYLAARRQELARNQNRPSFRMELPPRIGTTGLPRAVDSAVGGARPQPSPDLLLGPTFRPYMQEGRPFTYQEYSRSYFPRGTLGSTFDRPNVAPPTTFREFIQGAPGMLGGEVQRGAEGMIRRGMGLPTQPTQPPLPPAGPR